nr:MAG TPA: hypothetical protein [Caudoviricetes sp.]
MILGSSVKSWMFIGKKNKKTIADETMVKDEYNSLIK